MRRKESKVKVMMLGLYSCTSEFIGVLNQYTFLLRRLLNVHVHVRVQCTVLMCRVLLYPGYVSGAKSFKDVWI